MIGVEPLTDDAIRDALRRRAIEAYDTDEEIVVSVSEVLADEHGENLLRVRRRVRRLAPAVFAAQAAEERTWPVPTDCDRLDRAFAALERRGVVARQNFACCQTCGHAEIGDEIESGTAEEPVRGYAFFHRQDTESAAAGEGLYLAYGAVMPGPASPAEWNRAATEVAGEVVTALRAEGLDAAWNGDLEMRIGVPLIWRRRRRQA